MAIVNLLAAGALGLAGAPPALAGGVGGFSLHVIPFPGTPDASVNSNIIFSSIRPSDIQSVPVTGASSGAHTGALKALPDGAGTAFIPVEPFTAGEQVTVDAALNSPAAGTASGDPGATTLKFSFAIAIQVGRGGPPQPKPGSGPTQTFISEPALKPPLVT